MNYIESNQYGDDQSRWTAFTQTSQGTEYKMMSQQQDGLRSDSHTELLKAT